MAGRRHSRVLRRATATCGALAARDRRVAPGPIGVAPRWCLDTPSGSMPTGCTPRARRPRRSLLRRAACPPAGRRSSRRPPRVVATYGASAARDRRVAPGPVGVAPRWCLDTPSGSMPIACTPRARRLRRSAARPVGYLLAGRQRSRAQTPMPPTCGVSAARDRRAGRGPIGAEQPSSIPGPRLWAVIATASNGWVLRLYTLPPSPPPSAVCPPAGPHCGRRPP